MEPLLAPGGVVTDRGAAPAAARGGQPVRHDLPRALLVLLVPDGAARCFAAHGLEVFDVDELKSHGGSLRVLRAAGERAARTRSASASRRWRNASGRSASTRSRGIAASRAQVMETKWRLLEFLIARRREGKRIAGYGAPGKGNTLLNYCGIRTDLLDFTVDRNPYKQGHVPAGHAHPDPAPRRARAGPAGLHPDPALEPEGRDRGPARARARWGAKFVVPIPEVEVL